VLHGDDLAVDYQITLDLMELNFNSAYEYLYWELYARGLGWDCEETEAGAAGGAAGGL
jgi:hypothetical protein